MKTYNIAYAGLDITTWFLLVDEPSFTVKGAAYISKLADYPTKNPCNMLWKYLYRRYTASNRTNHTATIALLFLLRPFITSAWRKYHRFFVSIIRQRATILYLDKAAESSEYLRKNIDVLVVNVWDLLPVEIIDAPTCKTINIHPSMLPQYRGAVPTLMTLKNGDKESAVSYIILDAGVDSGELIGQHSFSVSPHDTSISLERRIGDVTAGTLVPDIIDYLHGCKLPVVQSGNNSSATPAYNTYRRIDWRHERAIDIYNKVNLYPLVEMFDYCFAEFESKKLTFKRMRLADKHFWIQPGAFKIKGMTVHIGTSNGSVSCRLFKDIPFKDSIYLINAKERKL